MSTVTVGAAGATGPFDYTCDGADDHVEIAAALAAVGAGGTVVLSGGTFNPAAGITIPAGASLVGTNGTVLQFGDDTGYEIVATGTNRIADLDLRGGIMLTVTGSDVACTSITSRQRVYGYAAFRVLVHNDTLEEVSFEDCHAIDTSGFGFLLMRTWNGTATRARNFTYSRCTAINCGASYDCYADANHPGTKDWITGFDFCEINSEFHLVNFHVSGCRAEGCWESGFHCEWVPTAEGCRIIDCTSSGNGTDPSPVYGCGFIFPPSWEMENCVSTGDFCGIRICTNETNPHAGESVRISRSRVVSPRAHGLEIMGTPTAPLSDIAVDHVAFENVLAPNVVIWHQGVTAASFSAIALANCTGIPLYNHDPGHAPNPGVAITYYLAPFAATPTAPVTGEAVAFTEMSANDGLTAWSWDFGDGSGSSAQHPTHAYPSAGTYPVTLAAGGNVVSQTVTVVPGVSYGGARLSEADLGPLDHAPVCRETYLKSGGLALQGSTRIRRAWSITCLTDDHTEIDALDALMGQKLTLNINGVEYPGTMIRAPFREKQVAYGAWQYEIGFVQERLI